MAKVIGLHVGGGPQIRALISVSKKGKKYARREDVEEQIIRLNDAPITTWPTLVRDGREEEYIKHETIAFLIREAWDRTENDVILRLHKILMDRAELIVRRRSAHLGIKDCTPVFEFVQTKLMERLYDPVISAAGEYLEVSFGAVVVAEVHRWSRKHGLYWRRIDIDADMDDLASKTPDASALEAFELLERQLTVEQIVQIAEKVLASPHFEAFHLYFVEHVPVESDECVVGLNSLFRRKSRTIYLWLQRAITLIKETLSRRPEDV